MVYHSPPLPTQPFSEETAQKHDLWIWIFGGKHTWNNGKKTRLKISFYKREVTIGPRTLLKIHFYPFLLGQLSEKHEIKVKMPKSQNISMNKKGKQFRYIEARFAILAHKNRVKKCNNSSRLASRIRDRIWRWSNFANIQQVLCKVQCSSHCLKSIKKSLIF